MARTGKRNKTKFVLCKELVILVVVLVAMVITTICLSLPSSAEKALAEFNDKITEYNTNNGTNYGMLEEDHVFKFASLDDISRMFSEKGTDEEPKYVYIVYGSLSNGTVLQYLTTINKEAQNREIENVYIYSSEKVDNQEDKDDEDFLTSLHEDEDIFNSKVLDGIDDVDLLKVPALYVYKNGELVFNSVQVLENGSYNWNLVINKAFSYK